MTDELAARRVPEWAKKLAEVKLGASLGIGVMPHAKWVAENPDAQVSECPEHLLEVSIVIVGHEVRPSALNPDPRTWPSVTLPPVHELCRIPWLAWRAAADQHWDALKAVVPA